MGRAGLQYLKQVATNTGTDSYTAMERMACNKSGWKAANQSNIERYDEEEGKKEVLLDVSEKSVSIFVG